MKRKTCTRQFLKKRHTKLTGLKNLFFNNPLQNFIWSFSFYPLNLYWAASFSTFYPFKRQPHKTVKHTQTIRRLLPTNCLSVFNHFVGLALKGLRNISLKRNVCKKINKFTRNIHFAKNGITLSFQLEFSKIDLIEKQRKLEKHLPSPTLPSRHLPAQS